MPRNSTGPQVRSTGTGFVNGFGRIGAMASPLLSERGGSNGLYSYGAMAMQSAAVAAPGALSAVGPRAGVNRLFFTP